jgi:hypothetical protein
MEDADTTKEATLPSATDLDLDAEEKATVPATTRYAGGEAPGEAKALPHRR